MRGSLLCVVDADIIYICETHLRGHDTIILPAIHDLVLMLLVNIHRNASGGVVVLVKDWVSCGNEVNVIDNTYEAIHSVKFTHKETENDIVSSPLNCNRTFCQRPCCTGFPFTFIK